MASDANIGDLYATLGIRVDPKAMKVARGMLDDFAKDAKKKLGGVGSAGGMGKLMGRAAGGIKGGMGSIAGGLLGMSPVGLGAAAVGAGFGFALKDALAFDDALVDLDINSAHAVGNLDDLRATILEQSRASGVSKEALLEGASAFIALTGDAKAATDSFATFARVQLATRASMEDIAGAAAAMQQQFGIGAPDFEKAFSILIAGGKAGAITMKDMAGHSAELSASFKKFKGSQGVEGLAELSATFQIAAQNFGGKAAETATGLKALFGAFTNASTIKKLRAAKIRVFDIDPKTKQKTLRSFKDLMSDIADSKLALDPGKLSDAFGSKEALNAFEAWRLNRQAWESTVTATMKANDVAEDAADRQKSKSFQLQKAWNDLKVTVAEAFSPEMLENFAGILKGIIGLAEAVIDAFITLGDWIDPTGSVKHARRMREEKKKFEEEQKSSAGRQNRARNIQALGSMFSPFAGGDFAAGAHVAATRVINPEFVAGPEHAAAEQVAREAFQSRPPVVVNQTINPSQGMSEQDLANYVHHRFKMEERDLVGDTGD